MGSSNCCSTQPEDNSELVLHIDEKSKQKDVSKPTIQKEKIQSKLQEDPATPGFADLHSIDSKRSEQSNKDIKLVQEIVMNWDEIPKKMEDIHQITSQRSLKKKRKDDSPICDFQPKNSLKSFDSKKLSKLKSLSVDRIEKDENDSQQSSDNKSVKSILKHELKYSKFRKMQTLGDAESRKRVHFHNK